MTVDVANKTHPDWPDAATLDSFALALARAARVPALVDRVDPRTCFGAFVMREMLSCTEADAGEWNCALHNIWKATFAHNWGIGRAADLGVAYAFQQHIASHPIPSPHPTYSIPSHLQVRRAL